MKLAGRTVISGGCASDREPLARAFLESGCRAYLGPVEDVDQRDRLREVPHRDEGFFE